MAIVNLTEPDWRTSVCRTTDPDDARAAWWQALPDRISTLENTAMDTLDISDDLKQIKAIQMQLATDGAKCPFHAKITEATDLTIALANKILDVDMAFKPIPGSQNVGGS